MQKSLIRKPVSIFLTLLMVLSVFGGLTVTADAATYTDGVDCAALREGDIFTNFGKSMSMLSSCENYTIRLQKDTFYDGADAAEPKDHDVEIPQPTSWRSLRMPTARSCISLAKRRTICAPMTSGWALTATRGR